MASVIRQPFAPLDGPRLQTLTSLKNCQNAAALQPSGSSKRKAVDEFDAENSENVNPLQSAKRSKVASFQPTAKDLSAPKFDSILKPFHLRNKSPYTSSLSPSLSSILGSVATPPASRPRKVLQPKSPSASATRRPSGISKTASAASSSTPAGRSPTGGAKRSGILSRRRTPGLGGHNASPFSLEDALKGTIPTYQPETSVAATTAAAPKATPSEPFVLSIDERDLKASWFFEIHEDSAEQDMTNLLQHSTCVLDISSDEETEHKASMAKAEGRDKENIPPADDVGQTSARRNPSSSVSVLRSADDMEVSTERRALGCLNVDDFIAPDCDKSAVFIVPADEDEGEEHEEEDRAHALESVPEENELDLATSRGPSLALEPEFHMPSIDALIHNSQPCEAAVLRRVEDTAETFDLWESGSVGDETEKTA